MELEDMKKVQKVKRSKVKIANSSVNSSVNPVDLTAFKREYNDEYQNESKPRKPYQINNLSTNNLNKPTNLIPTVSQHIKISVRLPRGIVTSLTLKKNIIALWMLYRTPLSKDPEQVIDLIEKGKEIKKDTINTMVNTFVHECLDDWDKDTGKGLSDFITERMLDDALEVEDHSLYLQLTGLIK